MPLITFIAGVALGAFAGFWYTVWAKRPKLQLNGQEGNGFSSGDPWRVHFGVSLAPARIGFRVGETRLFGHLVLRSKNWGLSTTRDTARNCSAWIQKANDKKQLTYLRWVGPNNLIEDAPVTIGPGDRKRLAVLGANSAHGPFHLLVDDPDRSNPDGHSLKLGGLPFTESEKFVVILQQDDGPRTRIKLRVTKMLNGTWDVRAAPRWIHTRIWD